MKVTPDELFKFLSVRYLEYQIPNVDSLREIGGIKHPSLSLENFLDLDSNTSMDLRKYLMVQLNAANKICMSQAHSLSLLFQFVLSLNFHFFVPAFLISCG